MNFKNLIYFGIVSVVTIGCNNGPKVITATDTSEGQNTSSGIFSETNNGTTTTSERSGFTENLHTVVVNEKLPTNKYVYLKVTEGGKQFWIAVPKQEVTVGGTYFYRDGLLKTNFESKEYKRTFDTIYLVTSIVAPDHGSTKGNSSADFSKSDSENFKKPSEKKDIPTHTDEIIKHKGSVKISDIVANPSEYNGKTVQITGKCVKVNPNIMKRNWIHLKDGSKDDFDLVVTSNTFVAEGQVVTMKAEVTLNKDFGAGYSYDLILENGVVIE
ncbi:GW dipeptide domain-containing protein [Ulvibacter antarcticus]|uniref:SH3 domain-containing protein n=1 Tax=Ulvibacter antarcticus TaxID=442714 RepID=A0A3L9YCZ9_9FLAO|nr:GW dipeptide domain-containing protein [Ulvibacter antarcticus]RMA57280.1 SH3 domain-containing protein [Ulvibacter antarcticus]